MAYQCAGAGPVLVLLAGQANSHSWWDQVRGDFEAERTTVTIDYRGTGDSDESAGGYSTEVFAQDVVTVLDALGVEDVEVYGTSMGGRVAQWVAATQGGRVRSLVLGCTSPGAPHGVQREESVDRSLAQPDRAAARRALLELMHTPAWLATHPGPYAVLGDPAMSARARAGHRRASEAHDGWDLLPAITSPTLVVHGDDDRLNPTANAAVLAGRLPRATTLLVPGARHAYFDEARATTSPAALDFLLHHATP